MKKFLTVFFAFTLYFNLISQANAAVGGWDLKNPVAQGASTVYDATKNVLINGKDFVKNSWVKITPPASGVAKVLARGAAGYALSIAVEQLLGSVDWVLDPANNQIKYNIPKEATCTASACNYRIDEIGTFASPSLACSAFFAQRQASGTYVIDNGLPNSPGYCLGKLNSDGFSDVGIRVYQIVDTSQEQEQKTLPLDVVAAQVISNAESGDTNAQVATTAAAADVVAEAENDDAKARPIASQAEANATTKPADAAEAEKANEATGTQTQDPVKPGTTDLTLEFPIFCNWAPTVCEAAQTVISFPQTLTNWWEIGKAKAEEWATAITETWTKVKEWVLTEPETEPEQPELPEPEQPEIDTDIAFDGQCPADREASVNMGVGVIKLPISYEPICTTVSTAKPILIFVGFFVAALIIGGVKTE